MTAETIASSYRPLIAFDAEAALKLPVQGRLMRVYDTQSGIFEKFIAEDANLLGALGKPVLLEDGITWQIVFPNGALFQAYSFDTVSDAVTGNGVRFVSEKGEETMLEDVSYFDVYPTHVVFIKEDGASVQELEVRGNGSAMLRDVPAPEPVDSIQAIESALKANKSAHVSLERIHSMLVHSETTVDVSTVPPEFRKGELIHRLRVKLGITQEKLSELAHISTGQISRIESGAGRGSREALSRIADALGLSQEDPIRHELLEGVPPSRSREPRKKQN